MQNKFKPGDIVYHTIFHKFGIVQYDGVDPDFLFVKMVDDSIPVSRLWLIKNSIIAKDDSMETKLMMDLKYGK